MTTAGQQQAAQYILRGRTDLIPQEGLDRVALLVDLINDPAEAADDKARYEAELFGWEGRLYALEALTAEEFRLIEGRETTITVYERGMDVPRDIRRPVVHAALWGESFDDAVEFDLWLQTWLWKDIPKPVAADWMVKAIMWPEGWPLVGIMPKVDAENLRPVHEITAFTESYYVDGYDPVRVPTLDAWGMTPSVRLWYEPDPAWAGGNVLHQRTDAEKQEFPAMLKCLDPGWGGGGHFAVADTRFIWPCPGNLYIQYTGYHTHSRSEATHNSPLSDPIRIEMGYDMGQYAAFFPENHAVQPSWPLDHFGKDFNPWEGKSWHLQPWEHAPLPDDLPTNAAQWIANERARLERNEREVDEWHRLFDHATESGVRFDVLNDVMGYYKANREKPGGGQNWLRVLKAFGFAWNEIPGDLRPYTAAEARESEKVWFGWGPVAAELEKLEGIDPPAQAQAANAAQSGPAPEYKLDPALVQTVRGYYEINKDRADRNHGENWHRVLIAFGQGTHATLTPYTAAEARESEKIWSGWKPVREALEGLEAHLAAETAAAVNAAFVQHDADGVTDTRNGLKITSSSLVGKIITDLRYTLSVDRPDGMRQINWMADIAGEWDISGMLCELPGNTEPLNRLVPAEEMPTLLGAVC